MAYSISYQSVSRVHETWEQGRQKYGSEAEFGMEILFALFRVAPGSKAVFGFQTDDAVESNPQLRATALVHGMRIVQMLDGVLTLLGPNMEMLEEILGKLGDRHRRLGVDKAYIILVGSAVRKAIRNKLGDRYTTEDDESWEQVFAMMSAEIIRSMD